MQINKIVLDANQFVSAILKPDSNPGQILEMVRRREMDLLLSHPIISEISRVLSYPKLVTIHGMDYNTQTRFLRGLIIAGRIVNPEISVNIVTDDPTDNKYIECAVAGNADALITGDKHLLVLKAYENVPIITPAQWLQQISGME